MSPWQKPNDTLQAQDRSMVNQTISQNWNEGPDGVQGDHEVPIRARWWDEKLCSNVEYRPFGIWGKMGGLAMALKKRVIVGGGHLKSVNLRL